MQNPEISGTEYQQGTLWGYELREYLLEKWNRTCAYCGAKDTRLEIEHIKPKSKGGSDRVSNLAIACHGCNQAKGNQEIEQFLSGKPSVLKRILSQVKSPLADTAAVNAPRWKLEVVASTQKSGYLLTKMEKPCYNIRNSKGTDEQREICCSQKSCKTTRCLPRNP